MKDLGTPTHSKDFFNNLWLGCFRLKIQQSQLQQLDLLGYDIRIVKKDANFLILEEA
jgi:hypothetical protein